MKQLRALLCLALLALAGCGGPEPEVAVEPVALVSLANAVTADIPVVIRGYGSVEFDPASKRTLNAEIEARVLELLATAGDAVEKDQVIVRLVPSTAGDTEVTRARRDAASAQAAAERTRRLRADGLASNADVEAADNTARDLLEQAASLEARSGNILTLRAPVSGVVDGLLAEPGDLVAPGIPIVRLASPDAVRARIGIEVTDAPQLQAGAPVRLRSLDNAATEVDTVISLVDTRIDPVTRMAAAMVDIPAGAGFLAGEAVRADITAGTRAAAVIVPRAAVFEDETGSYVFVAHGDTAGLTRVETGLTNGDNTEILAGIAAGDAIIVEGAATLADGMKIRTAEVPAHD
jgi:membrane fusion protein (multidrug efflux system)